MFKQNSCKVRDLAILQALSSVDARQLMQYLQSDASSCEKARLDLGRGTAVLLLEHQGIEVADDASSGLEKHGG